MAADPALLSRRGRLNVLTRHRGPDDPAVVALRREVAADALVRQAVRVVEATGGLTVEQRARIAAVLAPADAA